MFFSIGDPISMQMIMEAFTFFTNTTGLKVNHVKCSMYFGGMDDATKNQLQQIINFDEGVLPMKYLGVPLTRKKITIHHYMPLVDKIMGKVKH